ncbi:MAG: hypothetical protein C1941_05495 [Prosthecochloris sp.]|nr:hypothetical protein [Prosthecochloris sp.]
MKTLVKTVSSVFWTIFLFLLTTTETSQAGYNSNTETNWQSGINVTVTEDETISEELGIAGIHVEIRGTAEKELKIFAIKAKINGDVYKPVMVVAADAELDGTFGENFTCYAANAELSGTFNGDVTVKAARITLDPATVIMGNFNYSAASIQGLDKASISGTVSETPLDDADQEWNTWREDIGEVAAAAAVAGWILSLAAIIVTGFILRSLFPQQIETAVTTISASPWAAVGIGFVVFVATPPAIAITLATLVGIPLGLIAGMLFLIALFISQIFSGLWLGRKITGRFRNDETAPSFFWPFTLGILLIWLVGLIPFIGWLVGFIFTLLGLGALWLTIWHSVQANRA